MYPGSGGSGTMKNSIYKDFRLCIVAGVLWAAALIYHMRPGLIPGFAISCGAGIVAGSVIVWLCAGKVPRLRPGILVSAGLYCIVCSVASLCMAVSVCVYENTEQSDISAFGISGMHGRHGTFNAPGASGILGTLSASGRTQLSGSKDTSSAPVSVFVRAESPMTASDRRSFDCKIDAHITHVADAGGVLSAVSLPVRLYAKGGSCIFENHGYFAVTGAISRAQYGKVPYWISAGSRAGGPGAASAEISVKLVEKPKLWFRYINRMQNAFIAQTQRLSPQGRILVPGLTLGVMGNESFLADNTSASGKVSGNGVRGSGAVPERQTGIGNAGPPSIPSAYISRIKNSFLNLGIMHLMAVSGSHFALIAVFLRWILVRLHAHRKTVAGVTACGYCALYMFMYPSDSIVRALVMGMLGILALFAGILKNAFSLLNLTVIMVLLICPSYAWSFGFALSCSAVYGIFLFHPGLCGILSRYIPRAGAQAVSLTVCAQLLSLPVSILITPSIPVLSVAANLAVAPFVSCATVFGIIGFITCTVWPSLSFGCVWLASGFTQIMNAVSLWLSDNPWCAVPWPSGIKGVLVLATVYSAFGVVSIAVRIARAVKADAAGISNDAELHIGPRERIQRYRDDIRRSIFVSRWQQGAEAVCPPIKEQWKHAARKDTYRLRC